MHVDFVISLAILNFEGTSQKLVIDYSFLENFEIIRSFSSKCLINFWFFYRYSGTVVAYKKSGENATVRVRVKFDKLSQDKYDKW